MDDQEFAYYDEPAASDFDSPEGATGPPTFGPPLVLSEEDGFRFFEEILGSAGKHRQWGKA